MELVNAVMPMPSDLAQSYQADGYVFPLDYCSPVDAAKLHAELETAEQVAHAQGHAGLFRSTANMVVPMVDRLMRDPRITDAVAAVLGPDLLCWGCNLFIKEPRTPQYVSWHQDLHYWGLSDSAEVTAWLALSPSTVESGCVKFLPGSHRRTVAHADSTPGTNMLSRGQEIAVAVDESQAVAVELQAGQFSLHHGLTVHGSNANRSADRRIGIAMRYVSTAMANVGEARTDAFLVRGEDRFGHFDLVAPPRGLFDPGDVATAKRSIEKQYVYKMQGSPAPAR